MGNAPVAAWNEARKIRRVGKVVAWVGIVSLAVAFVLKYVFHYYLNYNATEFDQYWPKRGWLLLHISGGMLALLTGPWQFWSGLRQRQMQVHQWTGRLFLLGVAMGVTGATYLAITTSAGWAFGVALLALAWAWASAAVMALYFILHRQVETHKEWMVRTYVITFAFVTFRILNDYGPTSHLQPVTDRIVTIGWFSWTVPLFVTEMILQFRRARKNIV
jgi:Predicted membrane protein (DUF2306)